MAQQQWNGGGGTRGGYNGQHGGFPQNGQDYGQRSGFGGGQQQTNGGQHYGGTRGEGQGGYNDGARGNYGSYNHGGFQQAGQQPYPQPHQQKDDFHAGYQRSSDFSGSRGGPGGFQQAGQQPYPQPYQQQPYQQTDASQLGYQRSNNFSGSREYLGPGGAHGGYQQNQPRPPVPQRPAMEKRPVVQSWNAPPSLDPWLAMDKKMEEHKAANLSSAISELNLQADAIPKNQMKEMRIESPVAQHNQSMKAPTSKDLDPSSQENFTPSSTVDAEKLQMTNGVHPAQIKNVSNEDQTPKKLTAKQAVKLDMEKQKAEKEAKKQAEKAQTEKAQTEQAQTEQAQTEKVLTEMALTEKKGQAEVQAHIDKQAEAKTQVQSSDPKIFSDVTITLTPDQFSLLNECIAAMGKLVEMFGQKQQ